ncbi:MAG: DUF2330 domain-containing protein [Hyphomonas sp.]|uniref:DUF2330 domain-containing protein n=1 Tax=Hyphomonas sp. TaxID=87 RepID=UPI00352729F1
MFRWLLIAALSLCAPALEASAFCGFYVAQADGDLFNKASKVALARKGERTVITMANDYEGDLSEFAIVIPVPEVISREQVHIADPTPLLKLDAFSAPRLAEYYDDNPCAPPPVAYMAEDDAAMDMIVVTGSRKREADYGVFIEDSYSAGEYDIVILSAERGNGLIEWLNDNGYKLPGGAEKILNSYIKSDMKFFLAKVNLDRKADTGSEYLSPISIAYEDEDFALPIRLGTLNADGTQDLIAFMISSEGRVETSNYQTRKIPTDKNVPLFLKEEKDSFGAFYKALFAHQVKKAGGTGVFLEYFWDIGSCDPCAGEPPSIADLLELGVFWMEDFGGDDPLPDFETVWQESGEDIGETRYMEEELREETYWGDDLYLTRLHIRYDAKRFPEDLKFIETGDTEYFQGRYVINVPWRGEAECPAVKDYVAEVAKRQSEEFSNVVKMTGWKRDDVKARATANGDYPFTLKPKPPRTEPDDDSVNKAAARSIYDRYFWWGSAFPDLMAHETDD